MDSGADTPPRANSRIISGSSSSIATTSSAVASPSSTTTRMRPGIGRAGCVSSVARAVSRARIRSSRQMAMVGGIFIPIAAPPSASPTSSGDTGSHPAISSGSAYTAAVPTAVNITIMPMLSRMRRTTTLSISPVCPGSENADQKVAMPRCIARFTCRSAPGECLSIRSHSGIAARAVSGASTEVIAVAMATMGPITTSARVSAALTRPMARENSPICGIVAPTCAAVRVGRPARMEPIKLAAILPAINTATTASAGSM